MRSSPEKWLIDIPKYIWEKKGDLPMNLEWGQAVAASITHTPLPHPRSRTLDGGIENSWKVTLLQSVAKNMWVEVSLRSHKNRHLEAKTEAHEN